MRKIACIISVLFMISGVCGLYYSFEFNGLDKFIKLGISMALILFGCLLVIETIEKIRFGDKGSRK